MTAYVSKHLLSNAGFHPEITPTQQSIRQQSKLNAQHYKSRLYIIGSFGLVLIAGIVNVAESTNMPLANRRQSSNFQTQAKVTPSAIEPVTLGKNDLPNAAVLKGADMQSSVNVDSSGTHISVNGQTEDIPRGEAQSVQRSYQSTTDSGTTNVNISIQNNQSSTTQNSHSSSQSLNMRVQSNSNNESR